MNPGEDNVGETPPVVWPDELRRALKRDLPPFDWDGQVAPVCAEIVPIVEPHYRSICRVFWDHYVAHPAPAHLRSYYTPEKFEAQIAGSVASYVVDRASKSATATTPKTIPPVSNALRNNFSQ